MPYFLYAYGLSYLNRCMCIQSIFEIAWLISIPNIVKYSGYCALVSVVCSLTAVLSFGRSTSLRVLVTLIKIKKLVYLNAVTTNDLIPSFD